MQPVCQSCNETCSFVVLVDKGGPVITVVTQGQEAVEAIVVSPSADLPAMSAFTDDPKAIWCCETCAAERASDE